MGMQSGFFVGPGIRSPIAMHVSHAVRQLPVSVYATVRVRMFTITSMWPIEIFFYILERAIGIDGIQTFFFLGPGMPSPIAKHRNYQL